MSCTRGCNGVSICSGRVCCLQFEHDCGNECTGVADGFSTIQVNAAGELVVCSNVGGVCTCESVACTCDIVSDDTCIDGGVGADYAVREFVNNAGVLTLNGAPEHTTVRANSATNLPIPGNPHPPNPGPDPVTTVIQAETDLDLTNPSDCRDMEVMIVATGTINIQAYVPPLRASGGVRIFANAAQIAANNIFFSESLDIPVLSSIIVTTVTTITLAAGATANYAAQVVTGNWSNVDIPQIGSFVRLSVLGSTV